MDNRHKARELRDACENILGTAEAEGRSLSDEEKNQYDSKFSELESCLAQIKRADELAVVTAGLAEPSTPSVGPVAAIAPEDTRENEGVEVRVIKDRAVERGFDSIGEQLQAIAHASHPESRFENVDKRLHWLQERGGNPQNETRQSGASEAVASEGGYLVQKDFNDAILEKTYSIGEIASRVTRQAIGPQANGLTYNSIDESSRANGSRWGGVRAYWTAEAAALTASQPTFAQQTLTLKKLTALFYATEELLSDQTALAGLVERIVPEEIAFKVEDAILDGSGSGQPLGISNSAANITVAKESGQTATTIVANNVEKMWARCWGPSRSTAVWLINQDCEASLMAMADANSNAIYLPPLGLSDTPFSRIMNRPVLTSEYCATLGSVGDIRLVDLSQYLLIDKGAVRGDSSMHVRFLYDERAFRWMYRVDGQPMWNTALTPFNGSNTLSPFLDLAVRS
jgi:HK97 family phage major capsid protein